MTRYYYMLYSCLVVMCQFVLSDVSDGKTPEAMRQLFEKDGYLLVNKLFDKDILNLWKDFGSQYFERIFHQLHEKGISRWPQHARFSSSKGQMLYALQEGTQYGFKEIVMRNPGRYDLSLMHRNSTDSFASDLELPALDPLVQQLKSFVPALLHQPNMTTLNMVYSLIVSTPGTTEQRWHTDSEHLSLKEHLPCHCLNVFIPLVDVTPKLGPTELLPTSHYDTRQPTPYKIKVDPAHPPKAPVIKMGDALVFDYRLLHRGKPNLSHKDRPVLVLTFSQPGYKDTKNWPERSIRDKHNNVDLCDAGEPTCASATHRSKKLT